MRRLLFLVALSAGFSFRAEPADAQPPAGNARAAVERVEAELACITRERVELDRAQRLLFEASGQMRAHPAGSAEHADAARSAEAMEARVATAARALSACITARAPAPSTGTATAAAAAEPTPPPREVVETRTSLDDRIVSGPTSLTEDVHVVRGLQIDGVGQVDPAAVNGAVSRAAQGLHRCYEAADRSGARPRGELDVLFTVQTNGRTRAHAIEGSTLGNAALEACILGAARRISVGARAIDGDATFGYRLRFGPR